MTTRTIQGNGDDGHRFKLLTQNEFLHGYVRCMFEFDISWASGQFEVLTSEERINRFAHEVSKLVNGDPTKFEFLSDEGNLEIKVTPSASGRVEIAVLGIPNMAKDERIEFEFEGFVSETAGQ